MRSRTDRTLKARSNYEQLRLSVTRATDGRRFTQVWWKDKHQGWQYAHLVRSDAYEPVHEGSQRAQAIRAAIHTLEEELWEEEQRGRR